MIEFLSMTRLRSVSRSPGRGCKGEVAVWSLRRARFDSQAVVPILWNVGGTWWWGSGDGEVGSGKASGAVTELSSVVRLGLRRRLPVRAIGSVVVLWPLEKARDADSAGWRVAPASAV